MTGVMEEYAVYQLHLKRQFYYNLRWQDKCHIISTTIQTVRISYFLIRKGVIQFIFGPLEIDVLLSKISVKDIGIRQGSSLT